MVSSVFRHLTYEDEDSNILRLHQQSVAFQIQTVLNWLYGHIGSFVSFKIVIRLNLTLAIVAV